MNRALGRAAYWAATIALGQHGVFQHLREARRTHWLPAEELAERRDAKLGALLTWLRQHNGYYSPFLAGTPDPSDPVVWLRTLPLLEQRTLQISGDALLTRGFRARTHRKSTGGSTGAPVSIIKDADGIAREMAGTWAALESYGIRIGDRSVRFWGTPLTAQRRLRFRLSDIAMNRIRLSAFDLDHEDFQDYWYRCIRFRPAWMVGYASLIHMFAEWIDQNGLDGSAIGLRVVMPTSEPISEQQRDQIRAVFGAPTYDEYGAGEVGGIAYGCESGKLHVVTENVFVELLDASGRPVEVGEVGEVVVTDLTNRAMPLVRYRLGDRAVMGSKCDCGRGSPTLAKVLGRVHDVVFTPAGRRWHGEKIDYLMSQLYAESGAFRQYQVIQDGPDHLRICLVTDGGIPSSLQQRIVEYVAERLDGMHADVERVDRIGRSPSGKIRVVKNEWLPRSRQTR
jgi:phenylacetate-CoA ligase